MPKPESTERGNPIVSSLDRAQEPGEIVALLKEFDFTEADIAEGTDSDIRTVRRWKSSKPNATAARHLAEIRNVVLDLSDSRVLTDDGIIYWMRHPNRLLEGFSPLAVIGAAGFRSARDAAFCFADTERDFTTPIPELVRRKLERQDRTRREGDGGRRELEAVS